MGGSARTLTPHSSMSHHSLTQTGGKKKGKKTHTKKHKRSKKGSGHCNKGGSQKGGLGLGGIIREAMVPFGLLFFQKSLSKKKTASKDKKTRRFRRR